MMLCLVPHLTDTDTGRTNKMLTRETIHKNKTKSLQVLSEHYLCKNQDLVQFLFRVLLILSVLPVLVTKASPEFCMY